MCRKILGGYEYEKPPNGGQYGGRIIGIDHGFHHFW